MSPRTLAVAATQPTLARRWRLLRPRDIQIRYKLVVLLAVPLIAVVGLAAVRIVQGERHASDAAVVAELSAVSADVSEVSHALHRERMAAAEYLIHTQASPDAYNDRAEATNNAIAAYTSRRQRLGDVPASARHRLERIDSQLPSVVTIRREVVARQEASPAKTVLRYGLIMNDLVSYREQLDRVTTDNDLASTLRTNAAFSKAKWQASEEQATGYLALTSAEPDTERYSAFLAALTGQQEAFVSFSLSARPEQQAVVSATITGDAVELADRATEEVRRAIGRQPAITSDELSQSIGAVVDLMRVAEERLDQLAIDDARSARADVLDQVTFDSALVLAVLLLAILIAFAFSRSMVRSLAHLSDGAMKVADHDLPEVVAKLHDVSDVSRRTIDEIVEESKDPIRLPNRDEVGQVAEAFNAVHRSAVRVAAEQAALRASVSTMFLNLARRSQSIVDRMIGELDQVERGEDDPARLARLFRLDHLAVRMRRNDENLLVLAGADSSPPRHENAALADVIRAAQSEIELYERVDLSVIDQDVSVISHAVNDTARLLAELMDNATRFSPPDTVALVEAARMGESVVVQIADRGIGLSSDQLEMINTRLATPPKIHLADVRMLGLAVVNQLAFRYQIVVTLRPNPGGGTIAEVTLPPDILVLPKLHGPVERAWPQLAVAATSGSDSYSPDGGERPPPLPKRAGANSGPVSPGTDAAAASPGVNAASAQPAANAAPAALPQQYTPGAWLDRSLDQSGAGMPDNGRPVSLPIPVNGMFTPNAAGTAMTASPPPANGIGNGAAPVYGNEPVIEGRTVAPPTIAGGFAETAPAVAAASMAGEVNAFAGDETAEMPIFREVEAGWFRNHGHSALEEWPVPSAGDPTQLRATVPVPRPIVAAPAPPPRQRSVLPASQQASGPVAQPMSVEPVAHPRTTVPQPRATESVTQPTVSMTPVAPAAREYAVPSPSPEEDWATAADDGWRAAAAAASPQTAGTTKSGLVKRVPAANLVPGGVEPTPRAGRSQRTPERVRGLLSAYHRGVQRGRDVTQASPGGAAPWVEAGPWVGGSQTGGVQASGPQVTEETEQ